MTDRHPNGLILRRDLRGDGWMLSRSVRVAGPLGRNCRITGVVGAGCELTLKPAVEVEGREDGRSPATAPPLELMIALFC